MAAGHIVSAIRLLPIESAGYEHNELHRNERIWAETNCYVDVWVEVLHSLGLNPLAACGFTVATDFEGDQWTLFKIRPEDLQELFGIRVSELNVWRSVLDHVVEQLAMGRLTLVDVDGFFLPDTAGVSYQLSHPKTTIVPNEIDVEAKRLSYFHNASYHSLEGDDFDGLFRLGAHAQPDALDPYIEAVRLDRLERVPDAELARRARGILARHVAEMPDDNPVPRWRVRFDEDVAWLRTAGMDNFHLWAFGAVRQFGASSEIAAAHLRWLSAVTGDTAPEPIALSFSELATEAKALQFQLARLARGREVDVDPAFERMAERWSDARSGLERYLG